MSGNSFFDRTRAASIVAENEIIQEISSGFTALTGYSPKELIGKSIREVFNDYLRLSISDPSALEDLSQKDAFLFTKSLEPRRVLMFAETSGSEKKYDFHEQPGTRVEDKFINLFQQCKDNVVGIALYSAPEMVLLTANQKYLDLFKAPYNQLSTAIGSKLKECVDGWQGSPTEALLMDPVLTGRSKVVEEHIHTSPEWGVSYWQGILTPIFENGHVRYVSCLVTDVTEKVANRKLVEDQVRLLNQQKHELQAMIDNAEHQKQLDAVIDSIPDALVKVDLQGRCDYLNQAGRTFLDVIGMRCYEKNGSDGMILDGDGKVIEWDMWVSSRVLKGERINNFTISAKRSEKPVYYSLSGSPVCNKAGQVVAAVVCARDISQQRENECLIKDQTNRLQVILDNISNLIMLAVVDKNGNYLKLSELARNNLPESIRRAGESAQIVDYYDENRNRLDKDDLPVARVLKGESVPPTRVTMENGGNQSHYIITGSPIFDTEGNISLGVVCSHDITQEVKLREAIKQQQEQRLKDEMEKKASLEAAMRMKDEFLSLITHEFKTPLNVINSAVQLLELVYRKEISEKAMACIQKIKQNSLRQLRLVNNFLDITRINTGHIRLRLRKVDIVFLTKAIVESVQVYASQKNIGLVFATDCKHKEIYLDDEKYERILLNLLSNAIKFTPQDNRVFIEISTMEERVCVKVKDTGIGIPSDKLGLIFERFGQVDSQLSRQAEGTGIGLFLVKLFMEAMSGSVDVSSKLGKGSCFYLHFNSQAMSEQLSHERLEDQQIMTFMDNRLVKAAEIEFSDIYM